MKKEFVLKHICFSITADGTTGKMYQELFKSYEC